MSAIAQTIKGINILIGSDTTGLSKALGDVNKNARDIQSELRQVERLLKLDPTNTELLAQKQKLLADAVANSREKLDRLRAVHEQVNQQFKKGEISEGQYRAFQREVIKTEEELKRLEQQLGKVNDKWQEAANKVGDFGNKAENLGKKLAPVSAIAAGAGAAAVKMGSDFADALAKVSTIADTSEVPLDRLRESILELSNQSGIAATEIANNVYDAISAGQKTGDAVAFVEKSTKLAKAGFAEAGQSLDLLTTIMNAYGLETEKTGEVSDILIQVQNKGKVTVGELSSAMGKIIPTANAVGVGLDQVGAGYAILTSKGIKAAEATTYMNSMLNEMSKTGSKADKEIRELSGKSFQELIKGGKSVSDILAMLDESVKKNGLSLSDMFGSAEAAKAALTLLGGDAANFNNMVKEMNNSLGATEEAFNKVQTPGEEARKAFNKIKNLLIELGDVILPVVANISESIGLIVDRLSSMDERTRTTIVVIVALVAALAPVLIIIGKIATGIGMLISLFSAISGAFVAAGGAAGIFGGAIAILTGPVGLVIAAITALIAVCILLYKNWDTIKEGLSNTWNHIKDTAATVWNAIKDFFREWGESILLLAVGPVGWAVLLGRKIAENWDHIKQTALNIWNNIKTGIANIWTQITSATSKAVINLYKTVKSELENVWRYIKSIPSQAKQWGLDIIKKLIEGIKSLHIPKPHFSFSVDYKTVAGIKLPIPSADINWYAKGGIFTSPQVVGIGDVPEAVMPLAKLPALMTEALIGALGRLGSVSGDPAINLIFSGPISIRSDDDIVQVSNRLGGLVRSAQRGAGRR